MLANWVEHHMMYKKKSIETTDEKKQHYPITTPFLSLLAPYITQWNYIHGHHAHTGNLENWIRYLIKENGPGFGPICLHPLF